MKKLLVRGDDLGYSEGVTLGMLSAYEKGIVNSMAIMINMPYAKAVSYTHLPLCYLQYYYFHDEMLEQFDHEFTRADSVLAGREITVYQECRRVIENKSAKDSYLVAGVHGNYIVNLASSIINDKKERFIVNVKMCIRDRFYMLQKFMMK